MFSEFISNDSAGDWNDKLTEALRKAVAAVEEYGGKGALTITMTVSSGGGNRVTVDLKISSKIPQEPISGVSMFASDGQLTREDPRQGTFTVLAAVPSHKQEK